MKKGFLFVFILLGCILLVSSCGPMRYTHSDPAFSFEVVPGYLNSKTDHSAEVVRFAAQTPYKIPVYAAAVMDKPAGVGLPGTSQVIVDLLEKVYPGSSRFQIVSEKTVTLSDGSLAQSIRLKWKWIDRVSTLKSVFVVAFKGDKLIYLSGTDLYASKASYDVLEKNCMTLQLQ